MKKYNFTKYHYRKIKFEEVVTIGKWVVKVYTITKNEKFLSTKHKRHTLNQLQEWIKEASVLNLAIHYHAFLIIHEGSDGVWSLINWWIDGEMLQTVNYYSAYKDPDSCIDHPAKGAMACVWELEVICHERQAWINHVLKCSAHPRLDRYIDDVINHD